MDKTGATYLKTAQIARTFGLHPNSIRQYEEMGMLPPVGRGANGYRQYTPMHLEQVRLIRLSLQCTFLGGAIRLQALDILYASAKGNFDAALTQAAQLIEMIGIEHRQAEEAEKFLEAWAEGNAAIEPREPAADAFKPLSIRETAMLLDVTADMLRDWERNHLITIPRDRKNGYRLYGRSEINKLRVIRLLRRSRYSNMSILRVMQQLESGEACNLRELLDTPDFDEGRGYLCFTDNLLSTLENAVNSANQMIGQLNRMKQLRKELGLQAE